MLTDGTIVAGYELLQPLAPRSRSGVVYEAVDRAGRRRVAVKVIDSDLSDDDGFRMRFRDEVIKQGSLNHVHVLSVYEAGESQHGLFVAMAKVEGPSLRDLLASQELEPAAGLDILEAVAEALDAAHRQGLVHRNLKPENILVPPDGDAVLGDFGSARPLDGRMLVKGGSRGGEHNYISPEQARGEPATERSDLYALGAVLFETLAGSEPYQRGSAKAVVYAHLYRPVPVASERDPRLPEEIDVVLQRAMAKEPDDRYASASELVAAARAALGHGPVAPPIDPPRTRGGADRNGTRSAAENARSERTGAAAVATAVGGARPDVGDAPLARPSHPPLSPEAATAPPTEGPPSPASVRPASPVTKTTGPAPSSTRPTAPRRGPGSAAPTHAERPRGRRIAAVTTETAETSDRRLLGWRRGVLIGLLALLVIAGAAGASAILGRSRDEAPPPPPRAESGGRLGVTVPGLWRRLAEAPAVPGLRLADAIALGPPGSTGAALVAGTAEPSGSLLLPATLLRRLADRPQNDDTVALGTFQAYRYANLTPRGFDGRLNIYAVPTTAGVASVACVAPASVDGFLDECERVASTLELSEGEPVPLGPDRRYAARLDRAIARLNRIRGAGRSRLQGARTPAGQARTATALAAAYRRAATSLARGRSLNPAEQRANGRIVSALRTTQAAYTRMAAAARAADRGRYNAARAAVVRGEAAVQRGVEALEPLGYLLT